MKIERRDASQGRRVLTAMITDPAALGTIAAKWEKGGLFRSKWENLIGDWCVRHYEKYEQAPKAEIESLFERWAGKSKDNDTVKLVEGFLEGLSGDYEKQPKATAEYIIDLAAEHFNKVRKQKLIEELQADLEAGDTKQSDDRLTNYNRIELGIGAGVDVLRDKEAVKAAFAQARTPIVEYSGALGNFFGWQLCRDALICFTAPEKGGKSFWLIDIAWRAMLQGRKVACFQIGDMSQNQIMMRFLVRAAKHPADPGTILIPTEIELPPNNRRATVKHKEKHFEKGLDKKTGWKAFNALSEKLAEEHNTDECLLKLSVHPNNSVSIHTIKSILDSWDRAGWVPDVIVLDYADLLLPISRGEPRDQINESWKEMRGLSQTRHCLLVTATQAKAEAYTAETLSMRHFSEDKRKNAHVNGMIGISQTVREKPIGVQRLNWMPLREAHFDTTRACHVAGCLALANPSMKSIFQ